MRKIKLTWKCDGAHCVAGNIEHSIDATGADNALTVGEMRLTLAINLPRGWKSEPGGARVFCPWCKECEQ